MNGDVFVDTNILVYAHDIDAGKKHEDAKRLVSELWQQDPLPWISVQVLQEMLAALRRKGVPRADARETIEDYSNWRVIENDLPLLKSAMDEMDRWQLSLWDGMIIAAARSVRLPVVLSEDLSDSQDYGGIRIVNPFGNP